MKIWLQNSYSFSQINRSLALRTKSWSPNHLIKRYEKTDLYVLKSCTTSDIRMVRWGPSRYPNITGRTFASFLHWNKRRKKNEFTIHGIFHMPKVTCCSWITLQWKNKIGVIFYLFLWYLKLENSFCETWLKKGMLNIIKNIEVKFL